MKNKKNIATKVGAGILSTALASGQVHGNFKVDIPDSKGNHYFRTNAFYDAPLGVKGYTFMDLQDRTYFGKTFFTKNMGERLSAKTETKHVGEFHTQTGAGIEYDFSRKDTTTKSILDSIKRAKVNYLPIFVNKKGKTIDATQALGYAGAIKLPWNIEVSSFGQIILDQNGANWAYGEAEAVVNLKNRKTGKVGNKFIGWNGALINDGKGNPAVPTIRNRLTMGANF